MKPRDEALKSILALQFPSDWDPVFHEHLKYDRTVYKWPEGAGPGKGIMPAASVTARALGSAPGEVELRGGGCIVYAGHGDVQAALDHVLTWINRSQS